MGKRVYAFTDEAGNNGFDFSKDDISTHFIVTAIMVEEDKIKEIENEVEEVRKKFFQTGEMKSSLVGKNHERRIKVLKQLSKINFKIFSVVVDKRDIKGYRGLQYKKSFYKFINNVVHKELRSAFPVLTICADEIGNNEYMKSFIRYVKEKEETPNFLQDREFYFENSKNSVILQLADFISGTLLYTYDETKSQGAPNFMDILNKNIIRIENYPKKIESYIFNGGALSQEYDEKISNISLRRAQLFIEKFQDSEDEDVKVQLLVLKYLCFRFINNDTRKYIQTKEILNSLRQNNGIDIKTQYFRTKVIAKLRDNDVIISSSSKGYKLPAKKEELYDFINHGTTIIIPMLARLKKCRDIVKLETMGELDLFDNSEYNELMKYFHINL